MIRIFFICFAFFLIQGCIVTQMSTEKKQAVDFTNSEPALSRPVISKGDSKHLFVEEGKLVYQLCINRAGIVTYASYDEEFSTITDKEVINKGLNSIMTYKFQEDHNAPEKECGSYTFIFTVK